VKKGSKRPSLRQLWQDTDLDLSRIRPADPGDDDQVRWEQAHARRLDAAELRLFRRAYPVLCVILCLILSTALVLTVAYMPAFGREDSPTNNEVAARYIEGATAEAGAVNAVAGMIIYFRGFDTLGEAHVLFSSVCAVMILLEVEPDRRRLRRERAEDRLYDLTRDSVLKEVTRVLEPLIFLFGLYVIFNGHLSSGGGFSGGTVIGAGLILHAVAFGFTDTERFFNRKVFDVIRVAALLFYSAVMLYFFYTGANDLDAWIPRGTPGSIFSAGFILPVNLAVGLEVACTMYAMFSLFRRGRV